MNDEFDDKTDPNKDKDFIGLTDQYGKSPATPLIQEAAIDMQGVESMLEVQESSDHVLSSVRPSKRAL